MADSIRDDARPDQPITVDLTDASRSSVVDLAEMRAWINRAIAESGWNQEALASHLQKDKAYVSRVLSGEKPLSASFIRELPDDIERIVARYYAQSLGLVVVAPLSGPAAIEGFVGGLIGLLTASPLPVKADRMVSAQLPTKARRQA